ncbi:MAG: PP0621 family protein [Campylobacterales bacterium]
MVLKIIALIVAIFVIFKVIDIINKKIERGKLSKEEGPKSVESTFIECSKCGTYVDRDEAIATTSGYVCSKECLRGDS